MKPYEIEQHWVDIWNDLCDLDAKGWIFIDEEFQSRLSLRDAQGFVQEMVYCGYNIILDEGWHEGQKAIVLRRGGSLSH